MSRIQKLENFYKKQLEHKVDDVSEFLQSIIDVDITKGKYARFLIESFLNDKFLEEDLIGGLNSTVGQAISLFDKHKHKLPIEYRSVYALDKDTQIPLYQSPGDFWNSVKQFQGELSGKELKKEEQEQIYRETEFIYKDEKTGFQIVSPLTEESAKWWGKGTRWCTSAENNNMFWDYAKDAPLFILLMPNNGETTGNEEKLQLWKDENNIQFMDEADNKVSLNYIEKHWNILEPICLWLNDLRLVPENCMTEDICKLAVKKNGLALQFIPEHLIIEELCELAIQQNGWSLKWVPYELRTKDFCEMAVKQNGRSLKFIQQKERTYKLCELAVQNNGSALSNVPKELITKKICELAVQNNGSALSDVPKELITKELCELAIKGDGRSLGYVPEKFITKELCELAVQQKGNSLPYIPIEYRTQELCELAVQQNGISLLFVPKNFITKELCELAVKQNGLNLMYVPSQLKDELKHYVKDEIFELPIKKYKETFQEIKTFFPKKDISLSYHHL
jgi:hypothetical protein